MADHQVRVPLANEAGDFAAVLQVRLQFAVVDVEHFAGDAEDAGGLQHFSQAAFGKRAAGLAPVADVAIGHGHELHLVSFGGPHRSGAAGLNLTIVRVRPEADDAQFAVVRRGGGVSRCNGQANGQHRDGEAAEKSPCGSGG